MRTHPMNASTSLPPLVLCPSCGRPLQEFLLPSLERPGEFVRVWGCESCGETVAQPPAVGDESS